MKHSFLSLLTVLTLFSCKNGEEVKGIQTPVEQEERKVEETRFPMEVSRMFEAHGGFKKWNSMRQLSYTLPKKNNNETHIIDLKSRKSVINASNYTIGFDGNEVWMNKEGQFPINKARFYHNLYFYFYAMPFILGDKGIKYEKTADLEFEGVKYPGYKISYDSNIGDSPDDNYFVYYDSETYLMKWLGYTVTYGGEGPSNEIHYINYSDWNKVNNLLLPATLQWYSSENNLPKEPTSKQKFNLVSISKEKPDNKLFEKPIDALVGKK
ncbi:hypothetical protein [Pseudofulvibacter geojedonensis]|uniref:Threonine synthase n=1 Tax=Pseudofulvibacter geojedonensis TaxID=1123758 RepID=A0ABW3I396_9FLAO